MEPFTKCQRDFFVAIISFSSFDIGLCEEKNCGLKKKQKSEDDDGCKEDIQACPTSVKNKMNKSKVQNFEMGKQTYWQEQQHL